MKIKLTIPFPQRKTYLRFIMKTFVFLFCTTVFSFSPINNIFGQNTKITINADKTLTVYEVFDLIRAQTEFTFIYQSDIFKNTPKIHLKKGVIKANELLEKSLSTNHFSFALSTDKSIIIKPKTINNAPEVPVKVTGKVTDEAGLPLAGVTVRISGTNNGVATNFDGNYTIIAPSSESVLVFSSIGFTTKEIIVGEQTTIDVIMQETISQLDEVVINAGYYNVSERERTGSIAKIEAKDIEKQPVNNPLAAMQGRLAGVDITQTTGVTGGGFNIEIRGKNFFDSGTEPLYVIDGVPFSSETLGSSLSGTALILPGGNTSPLNAINPADIESIEVLKDADATAIYGSRGANGVVLITTKKGKVGKTRVNVNLSSSLGKVTRFLDLMNTEQYLEMRLESFTNDGRDPLFFHYDVNGVWDQTRDTDWQKELIGGTAYRNNAQVSFSGGSAQTQFLVSGAYQDETMVFPGDFKYNKASVLGNIGHQSIDNRFKINFSVNYVADENHLPFDDFTRSVNIAPNAPALYDDEGNVNFENNTFANPLLTLETDIQVQTFNLISNTTLSYQLIPSLELKTNFGFNDYRLESSAAFPHTRNQPWFGLTSSSSSISINNTTRRSWIVEPQLNWQRTWGAASLNVLMGATFQQQKAQQLIQSGRGFSSNILIHDLSAANTTSILGDNASQYNYQAFFGRLNFNWKDKYIVNLTGRRDGSSRFGSGRQFGDFGAIGAAWLFSEENFLKNNSILSFGKLRASYGTTGSDNVGNYKFLDTYSTTSNNYDGISGLNPAGLFNPIFGWEENKKMEAALELGFLKDRIFLSAAWYNNRSSNQLIDVPLPTTTGFNGINANFDATVENKGLEFNLRSVNIQKDKFKWSTTFTISANRNKLVKFDGLEGSTFANRLEIGQPLSILKLYHLMGVDPDTGVYQFEDFNNDGTISNPEDRQVLKDLTPKFFGGLGNTLSYRNLQLDFFFQFKKQEGENFIPFSAKPGLTNTNQRVSVFNRWQQPGDTGPTQIYSQSSVANRDANTAFNNYRNSDATVTDASFIRLRNVSLTYTVPKKIVKGMDANIYLQGQNLLTITNYDGFDPEQRNQNNLPPLRQLTLGLNLSF